MVIDVTLQVSGIDLDDARNAEVLREQFPTLLWHRSVAGVFVTFEVEELNAPAEVLDVVRKLESVMPAFRAIRVDRDLVSTTDIAARVGVSREAARKWGKASDFPVPVGVLGNSHRAWLWRDVIEWLDMARGIVMDEHLPSEAVMVQIDNCLMRNPDAITVHWERLNRRSPSLAVPAEVRNVTHIELWRDARVPSVFRPYSAESLAR